MIDTRKLLAALEQKRTALGDIRGDGAPLAWAEVARQIDTHQATFSRLKAGQPPGSSTLTRIYTWLGESDFTVVGDTSLPVAGRDDEWDGGDATARIFDAATADDGTVDTDFVAQAFLYRNPDDDPAEQESYKLPFADMMDGTLTIFPRAVAAVASGHGLAQADIPDGEVEQIENKICDLYDTVRSKYEDWPPCPYEDPEDQSIQWASFAASGAYKEYSPEERERMAESGEALPDGSYPIADCEDLANAIQAFGRASDPEKTKAHIRKRKKALGCEDVDLPETWDLDDDDDDDDTCAECGDSPRTAAIIGRGSLSESENEVTQQLVIRARELLNEGAVGVSIRHDLDPDDMPDRDEIERLMADEDFEGLDALMADVSARPRHVAIVDTAAFSDARLTVGEDGLSVEGPVTFEGIWTGDMREMPYGGLVWENVLPIPLIWDSTDNDHDGAVVGYITELERVDGMTSSVRPDQVDEDDVDAVTASAGSDTLPARYFARFAATGATPLTISEPDASGLRHVYGHTVPHGVCHRSDMAPCFQYPGDVDPAHKGFHTGSPVKLDDGTTFRAGALTFGGGHVDAALARKGVPYSQVNRHREDSNQVFALVRAWEDRYGLAVAGVVLPGVSKGDLLRAKASAPSVELWPRGSGRTLVGVHLVPTPAWPVAASAGSAELQTVVTPVEVEGDLEEDTVPQDEPDGLTLRLDRIEKALAILLSDRVTDGIPAPEDPA